MKYFSLLVFSFIAMNVFADGGKNKKSFSIESYEPNLNLQFIGMSDTIHYIEKKKEETAYIVSNIAIYDIANNKTNYVFNDTVKRNIVGFYFESKYIEEFKTIEFNNEYDPSDTYNNGLFQQANNRNVSSRPLSNNLIIITEDVLTNKLTFWICDKYGNNLKKEIEISNHTDWDIDVKNRMIRIIEHFDKKIEIQNIKY